MLNVGQVAPLPVNLNQNPARETIDAQLSSIFELLKQAVIDVPAVKKQLSEYTKLAMMNCVNCQPAYEKVLRLVADRLHTIVFSFQERFDSLADFPLNKQVLESIRDVIFTVQNFQSTPLAVELLTHIIALKRLDVRICLQKGLHAQIIEDYRELQVDTGLRESVEKRTQLFAETRILFNKLDDLSVIQIKA